jgi:site-specific recombinase XerC
MTQPSVPEVPVAVVDEAQIADLLATATGSAFEDRRDAALLRVFLDCGLRLSEVATIRLDEDLDLANGRVTVMGKGERTRTVPFGQGARAALIRYLKARSRHRDAEVLVDVGRPDRPRIGRPLWLGRRGALKPLAVRRVVERRAREAGITGLHPHMFRHTWAADNKADGMSDGDLMVLGGWRSREMLDRYGKATATQRALAAYRSPMDRRGL